MKAEADAWAEFLAAGTTFASSDGDFTEWHRGRPHFAVWAIAVRDSTVEQRMDTLRRRLGDLLRGDYRRQPHITLHVCGFPCASASLPHDFGREQLLRQVRRLAESRVAPFEISVVGPGSFASAPFLGIDDHTGGIRCLRDALALEGPDDRSTPYVPHLTLGLYADTHPTAEIVRRLGERRMPPHRIVVDRLDLMAYESAVIGGPLHTLCSFDLARRRLA